MKKTKKSGRKKLTEDVKAKHITATLDPDVFEHYKKYITENKIQNKSKLLNFIIKEFLFRNEEWS